MTSISKLFADDTSLFPVVHDISASAKELNEYFNKINSWAFQWKMNFNPDPIKQAQEVLFSRKLPKESHPNLFFNNSDVSQTNSKKHLGAVLDSKLTFHDHLDTVFTKVRKTIGLLRKLNNISPRAALGTIFKTFVRPHLDYGDVLYDQAFNSAFQNKFELIQYNTCLATTGAIRDTSRENLYQELSLGSLQLRRWCRKLCLFYNILKNQHPQYLFNLILVRHTLYNTRNVINLPFFNTKHSFFKISFFPLIIIEWNKLDINLRNSRGLFIFKKHILQFIRPSSNYVYNS